MGKAQRDYYRRNREAILAKQRIDRTVTNREKWKSRRCAIQASHRERIDVIKLELGCADCGYNGHPAALDFDHLDGHVKLFQIAACAGKRWELVVQEMAKCEVVCANCHRIRTFNRRRALCA